MNHRKFSIALSLNLLALCLFAGGCNASGGGNTNNTTNGPSNNTGKHSSSGNSSSPIGSAQPLPNALTGASAYVQTAQSVRERIGQRYTYACPPNVKLYEGVYGNDAGVYFTGSSICSAAIHAGIITQAKGGQVTIEIGPAASPSYPESSERNGVTPRSMIVNDQKDNGTFTFVKS